GEVTGEVTGEVERLLCAVEGDMSRSQLQAALALRGEEHFRNAYLKPALTQGLIEMTLPERPRSRMQRYRLTSLGRQWLSRNPK
ncbi:MAG: transcriptional regulator, partial [Betaproteobacteria bacterium]|nr:transcriptional regulator [Betaproteobacteria bacterium]